MTSKLTFKIGTRGSALALYQANLALSLLEKSCRAKSLPYKFEIVEIKTTGDKILDRPLSEVGGKALFTKEIDIALLDGRIDIAVHSMKDCETWLPKTFKIAAILEREDPRDAFISHNNILPEDLAKGSTFGTCSLRRKSQILHLRPDLKTILFRGNIQTRINKVQNNEATSTMLAISGLNRMGLAHHACHVFSPHDMTPSACQGAIGAVCLKEHKHICDLLSTINHKKSFDAITLERSFLEHIDGHCSTPVGCLVTFSNNNVHFIACVATPDGKHLLRESITLSQKNALLEINKLGEEMKQWLVKHNL